MAKSLVHGFTGRVSGFVGRYIRFGRIGHWADGVCRRLRCVARTKRLFPCVPIGPTVGQVETGSFANIRWMIASVLCGVCLRGRLICGWLKLRWCGIPARGPGKNTFFDADFQG